MSTYIGSVGTYVIGIYYVDRYINLLYTYFPEYPYASYDVFKLSLWNNCMTAREVLKYKQNKRY